MITFDGTQSAIASAVYKKPSWLFEVFLSGGTTPTYYWSTKTVTYSAQNYVFKVLSEDFHGVSLTRAKSEFDMQAPSTLEFTITNKNNTLSTVSFEGATVLLKLVVSNGTSETILRQWRFAVKACAPMPHKLKFVCEDLVSQYLTGDYPNTPLIKDMFPVTDFGGINDNMCIPVPFGTVFIPLRAVYSSSARRYLLGPSAYTYTISKVQSPHEWGANVSTWSSGAYTFSQTTESGRSGTYKCFQPIIADSDADGTVDACGIWRSGSKFLDMPTKFSRSDLSSKTNPADIIKYVLEDIGIPSTLIDSTSFTTAGSTYAGWGLTFNGAYFFRQPRKQVIANLLSMCHSTLVIEDTIKLKVLSKTSQKTLTPANILTSDGKESTYGYTLSGKVEYDSGYVAYQETDKPQDSLIKVIVTGWGTTAAPAADTLLVPFVTNSQHVQKIGTLHYQRKFGKKGSVKFVASGSCLALQPDDVITINHANYGGSTAVLIDAMSIKKDLSIEIVATSYQGSLSDWGDPTPSPLVIAVDDTTESWSPVVAGPDGANVLAGSIVIGANSAIKTTADPATNGGFIIENRKIGGYKATGDKIFELDLDTEVLTLSGTIVQSASGATSPLPCPRGAYDAGATYYKGDIVIYDGSSWMWINSTEGNSTPADNDYWDLYAQGGTGSDGRTVSLSTTGQAVVYDTSGGDPSPSSVTLTATAYNCDDITPYYDFYVNGISAGQNTIDDEFVYSIPTAFSSMPKKIEVKVRASSTIGEIVAEDTLTLFGIKAGANAINAILSNEAHVLPANSAGVVTSYTGSGTDINVYDGATRLSYNASPGASQYSVAVYDDTNITASSALSISGDGYTATYGPHSAMSADTASITYLITAKNAAGTTTTINKTQTFSKAKAGAEGDPGDPGVPGYNTATLLVYKRSSSPPDAPTGSVTYTFSNAGWSTTTVTSLWYKAIPAGTDPLYVSAGTAYSNSTTAVVSSWAAPVKLVENGTNGLNVATVYVYRRTTTSSAPAKPSTGYATYSFTEGITYSSLNNTWTSTIPAFDGTNYYLWVCFATASDSSASTNVLAAAFSTAQMLSSNGTQGAAGLNGVTINLSNDAHTILTDADGNNGVYTNSGTDITVFEGATQLAYNTTGVSTFSVGTPSVGSITAGSPSTVSTYTRRFAAATNITADTAYIDFPVTVRDSAGGSAVYTVRQTFSRVKAGTPGAPGAPGAPAYSVSLVAASPVVTYNIAGTSPSPSGSMTVTAYFLNTSGTVYYRFNLNGTQGTTYSTTGTSATYPSGYSIPASYTAGADTIEVEIGTASLSTVWAKDKISIARIRSGGDAITVSSSNEAHTLPVSNTGVVDYSNSGTVFRVWEGATPLDYGASGDSTFSVSGTGTGIVASSPSNSGQTVTYGNHSSMTTDSAKIEYTITVRNSVGQISTHYSRQTFAKSVAGADGESVVIAQLSNEAHLFAADKDGVVASRTGSGTTVSVSEGTTALTYVSPSTTPGNGQWRIASGGVVVTPTGAVTMAATPTTSGSSATFGDVTAVSSSVDSGICTFTITGKTLAGVSFTKTLVQSFAKSKAGTDGTAIGGQTVNLTAGDLAFTYDSAGNIKPPASTTITATARNCTGTLYYAFHKNGSGTASQNNSTNTYTYTPAAYASMPETIEVKVREGSSTATVVAEDQITVIGVKEGAETVSVLCTNSAHVFPADSDGVVAAGDYAGSGCTIAAYLGAALLTYDSTNPPAAGQWTISGVVATNITAGSPVGTTTRTFVGHLGMSSSSNTASIKYTCVVKNSAGTVTTHDIFQSFSKTKSGANGVNGNAVSIAATKSSWPFTSTGALESGWTTSSNITCTWSPTTETRYFAFVADGAAETTPRNTTGAYTYTAQSTYAAFTANPRYVKVLMYAASTGGTALATDTITFAALKEGSGAVTAQLSNATHAVSVSSGGTPNFTGSGTTLIVWEGATALTRASTLSAGKYTVTRFSTNVTAGTDPGGTSATFPDITAMSADTGSIRYYISAQRADGTSITPFNVYQTFNKVYSGANGAVGPGIVPRGEYASGTTYYNESYRRDLAQISGVWNIYKGTTGTTHNNTSTYWESFGASFSSVATGLLLAEDAAITKNLTIGVDGVNYGTVRSTGKTAYGNATAGFWLGYDGSAYKLDIGNSTNYIRWTGSAVSIASSGTDAIVISGTGGIKVDGGSVVLTNGGDVQLYGSGTNPATIFLQGSSYYTAIYTNATGAETFILPGSDEQVHLKLGLPTSNAFSNITLEAGTNIVLNATNVGIGAHLYPTTANVKYCGTAANCWNRVYTETLYYETTSQVTFDDLDDLSIIDSAKPIIDEASGKEQMDVSSFPDKFFSVDDETGEINRKWINAKNLTSLLIGAVKQANKVITEDVIEQFNAMIEDQQTRIAALEKAVAATKQQGESA